MDILIRTRDDLIRVMLLNSWLKRPAVRRVEINFNSLDMKQKKRIQRRIEFLFNDCGCLWAAPVFVVTFLSIWGFYYVDSIYVWALLGLSLILSVLVALMTKFMVMYWSYRQLETELNRLLKYC